MGAEEVGSLTDDSEGECDVAASEEPSPPVPAAPWWRSQIREIAPNQFCRHDQRDAGRLHMVNTNSWKATCRSHTSCVCWVSVRAPDPETPANLREELVEWLAHGLSDTKEQHHERGRAINISKGMRIRG